MGRSMVKRSIAVVGALLLLFVIAGCASSSVSKSSSLSSSGKVEIESNTTDEMRSTSVSGAELFIFQFGDKIITTSDFETLGSSAGAETRDGGFYRMVADVTYLNGGVAGYVNYPQIERVTSCSEVSPFDLGLPPIAGRALGLSLIGDYADGDVLLNTQSAKGVWKDGNWIYRYDSELELGNGSKALVRKGVSKDEVQARVDSGVRSCEDYFVLPAA